MGAVTKVVELLVHATFLTAVFLIATKVPFRDFCLELRRWHMLLRTFAVAGIIVPLMTAGIVKAFDVPLTIGGIMLVAGISPGDSFALLEARSKKGNVPFAAATMAFLCILMPFTVPLWLWLFSSWFSLTLKVSPMELFLTIAPITILPLIAGIWLRSCYPGVSEVIQSILSWFFRVAIIIVTTCALILGFESISQLTIAAMGAAFTAVSLALVTGYYAAGGSRKDRISLGLTASLGNLAVVMLVARISYPGVHVIHTAVLFVILRSLTIMLWYLVLKLRLRGRGESLLETSQGR